MRIEKDVLIDAPAEVVWAVVTEPDQVRRWFADEVTLEARPGADGTLVFKNAERGDQTIHLRVVEVRRPERFSFRWTHPEGTEPGPANSVLVEFTLEPEGDGTRLRVIETGADELEWTEQAKAEFVADHTGGWEHFMARAQEYAGSLRPAR